MKPVPVLTQQHKDALELIWSKQLASTSLIQSRMQISYSEAESIMNTLTKEGWLGPKNGAKPRKILVQGLDSK